MLHSKILEAEFTFGKTKLIMFSFLPLIPGIFIAVVQFLLWAMPSILGDKAYYNFLYVDTMGLLWSNNCSIFVVVLIKYFLTH